MAINQDHIFIKHKDETARLINDRANHLYRKLSLFNINNTSIDEMGKRYFINHHAGHRLFFSIQSSANIIYHSVALTGKTIPQISFIDYGAGLGTLFLLAGSVGFKKVYFNDYFPQWASFAKTICSKIDISIDDFISGDICEVINYGKLNNVHFDIVASRNVVEHIYNLRQFYAKLYQSGITSVCFATTTANYHNPAMRLKHYWHHYQVENTMYKKQRAAYITELFPNLLKPAIAQLVSLTRGRAFADFTDAIQLYLKNQPIPAVEFLRTNTCDCMTGVWAENLITRKNYIEIIEQAGFKVTYTPGFWDTHYKYKIVNVIAGVLNRLINIAGKKGYWFSPFVNVTATKN